MPSGGLCSGNAAGGVQPRGGPWRCHAWVLPLRRGGEGGRCHQRARRKNGAACSKRIVCASQRCLLPPAVAGRLGRRTLLGSRWLPATPSLGMACLTTTAPSGSPSWPRSSTTKLKACSRRPGSEQDRKEVFFEGGELRMVRPTVRTRRAAYCNPGAQVAIYGFEVETARLEP